MTVQPGPQISERSIVVQKVGAISGQALTAVAARASAPSAAIPPTSASPTTHSLRVIVAILPFEKGDLHHATSDPRPRQSEEAALVADDFQLRAKVPSPSRLHFSLLVADDVSEDDGDARYTPVASRHVVVLTRDRGDEQRVEPV